MGGLNDDELWSLSLFKFVREIDSNPFGMVVERPANDLGEIL